MKITSRLIVLLGFCMAVLLLLAWPGESQAGPAVPENPPASEISTDWTQAKEIFSESLHQVIPSKFTAAALPLQKRTPAFTATSPGRKKDSGHHSCAG